MDSLPEQHISDLPKATQRDVYEKLGRLCAARSRGVPEEQAMKMADWGAPEEVYEQLKRWVLSGVVPPGDALPRKDASQEGGWLGPLKGEPEELPPAANAADLFKYGVRSLKTNLHWIRNLKQIRTGRAFETLGHYPDEDEPRRRGFWPHPHPHEVNLIMGYLLNYHAEEDIDALLQRLHPRRADPAARRETGEMLAKMLFGDPKKPNRGRGLFGEIGKIASVVRGVPAEDGKLKGGRPGNIPEGLIQHGLVREKIAAMRQEGFLDAEIVRELRERWGLGESRAKALLNFRAEGW